LRHAPRHSLSRVDRTGLRYFGLVTALALVVVPGLLIPWLFNHTHPIWPWTAGGLLVGAALLVPNALRVIHTPWMWLAFVLNRLSTPLIAALVFLLVVTPAACILRMVGHDPMVRRFDRNARSYRIASANSGRKSMERPF